MIGIDMKNVLSALGLLDCRNEYHWCIPGHEHHSDMVSVKVDVGVCDVWVHLQRWYCNTPDVWFSLYDPEYVMSNLEPVVDNKAREFLRSISLCRILNIRRVGDITLNKPLHDYVLEYTFTLRS